jgi:hypothetical protein
MIITLRTHFDVSHCRLSDLFHTNPKLDLWEHQVDRLSLRCLPIFTQLPLHSWLVAPLTLFFRSYLCPKSKHYSKYIPELYTELDFTTTRGGVGLECRPADARGP